MRPGDCSDAERLSSGPGTRGRRPRPPAGGYHGIPGVPMSWIAWLRGRDEVGSRSYDFIAECPFWQTWWFRIVVIAAGICVIGFFRLAMK